MKWKQIEKAQRKLIISRRRRFYPSLACSLIDSTSHAIAKNLEGCNSAVLLAVRADAEERDGAEVEEIKKKEQGVDDGGRNETSRFNENENEGIP
jgi:hypothetical protein